MGLTNEEIIERFNTTPSYNPDLCIYKVLYRDAVGNTLQCADCTASDCVFSGNYKPYQKDV